MSVTVLISCMHQKDASIIERTGVHTDAVVVNQCDEDNEELFFYINDAGKECKVKIVNSTERGLSRSRNLAIQKAWGDYCIFADDDEILADDYERIIQTAFDRNVKADIVAFNYKDQNSRLKDNYKKPISEEREAKMNHNYSSVAIAFRLSRIIENEVWFDPRIGAGSGIISAGEESVWQALARKKGLRIFQCPDYIATVSQANSTWFRGYDERYFYDLGANLTARYGFIKYIFQFYYPYRLRQVSNLSIWQQLYYINAGMRGFKKSLGFSQYFHKNR